MPYGTGFIKLEVPDSANVKEIKPRKIDGLSNVKESFLNSINNS